MPVETRINEPFIPQEGISGQILQAMQLANEHYAQQKQLAMQQQGLPSEIALRQAQTGQAAAETSAIPKRLALGQQQLQATTQLKQAELEQNALWRQTLASENQQKIDLGAAQQAWRQKFLGDQENFREMLGSKNLDIRQALAKYSEMDDVSKANYRAMASQALLERTQTLTAAEASADRLKTAEAYKALHDAQQSYSVTANIARAFGLSASPVETISDFPHPMNLPTSGPTQPSGGGTVIHYDKTGKRIGQ